MVSVLDLYKILKAVKVMIIGTKGEILYEGATWDIPIICMCLRVNSLEYENDCCIIRTE